MLPGLQFWSTGSPTGCALGNARGGQKSARPLTNLLDELCRPFQSFFPLLRIWVKNRVYGAPILAAVTSIAPPSVAFGVIAYSPKCFLFQDTA